MDLIDSTGFLIGLLRLGCVLKSSGSPSHLELMLTPLEKVIAGLKDAVLAQGCNEAGQTEGSVHDAPVS